MQDEDYESIGVGDGVPRVTNAFSKPPSIHICGTMSTCQNVEDTAKDELMPRRPKQDKNSNICLRCKTARGQIVIRHCIYCK